MLGGMLVLCPTACSDEPSAKATKARSAFEDLADLNSTVLEGADASPSENGEIVVGFVHGADYEVGEDFQVPSWLRPDDPATPAEEWTSVLGEEATFDSTYFWSGSPDGGDSECLVSLHGSAEARYAELLVGCIILQPS